MFSTAIIIFREVFEITLILGIVMAATRGLDGRMKAVGGGFLAGLLGAFAIAAGIDTISDFAEGMGQEILNAGILFLAAFFIGWTVLWMARHAREMTAKIKHVGQNVSTGEAPLYALSAIIGFAILREGAEVVLFSYGMLASGQSLPTILIGAAMGTAGGVLVGTLIYLGLIQLSVKHLLTVTSWLLVFLVASLTSQGVRFLVAANVISFWNMPVWDTSAYLSDTGAVGQVLHALVGYSARPIGIQLATFALILAAFTFLLPWSKKSAMKQV